MSPGTCPTWTSCSERTNCCGRVSAARGHQAEPVVWNRPGIDWNRFDIALFRSTWDYLDDREHFLRVLGQIEASACTLLNPLAAVRWNMDKRYLFDLKRWGVPIVPTFPAAESGEAQCLFAARGWPTVVLKPAVGLGAAHVWRVPLAQLDEALARRRAEQPGEEYLLQPYCDALATEGEWSYVYFNGQLSHVLLKRPADGDYRVQGIYGGTIRPAEPRAEDRALTDAVLKALPFDMLYARLDFVRHEGRLAVIEVELIEPIFSFNLVPESIDRLVAATLAHTHSADS